MKIKNIITVFLLLFFAGNVSAQSPLDIIFLKNGARVKGVIDNFVPNDYLEIFVDDKLVRYEAREIKRVVNNRNNTVGSQRWNNTGNVPSRSSAAVNVLDIVFLKDGKRIRGYIENYVPNEYLEIQVKGEIVRYEASEIKRVVNNGNTNERVRTTNNQSTYQEGGETVDEVQLMNGEVIRGSITDMKRGEFVEIEVDGTKKRYEQEEIRRIKSGVPVLKTVIVEKEPKVVIDPATLTVKGIYNATYISFAYGSNVEGEFNMGPGIHSVTGKQWGQYKGIGVGVGIDNYRASRGETVFPLYLDYRMYPFKKNKTCYLNAAGGYGFAFKNKSRGINVANGGLYGNAAVGFRSATKDGVSMNLELGYRYQYAYFEEVSAQTGNDISKRENHYQRLTFRIGLMFWTKKKNKRATKTE